MSDLTAPKTQLIISDNAKEICFEAFADCKDTDELIRNIWYDMKQNNRNLFNVLNYGIAVTEVVEEEIIDGPSEASYLRSAFKFGACVSYLALSCNEEFDVPVLGEISTEVIRRTSKYWDIDDLALASLQADSNLNEVVKELVESEVFVKPTNRQLGEEAMALRLGAGHTHYLLDRQYQLSGHAESN